MLRFAIRKAAARQDRLPFALYVRNGNRRPALGETHRPMWPARHGRPTTGHPPVMMPDENGPGSCASRPAFLGTGQPLFLSSGTHVVPKPRRQRHGLWTPGYPLALAFQRLRALCTLRQRRCFCLEKSIKCVPFSVLSTDRFFGCECKMNQRPYSVFVRPRPVRTAFLVDTGSFVPGSDRFEALVDALIRHNYQLWGGRTNPIIFFSGESLSPDAWLQLRSRRCGLFEVFHFAAENLA